MSMHVVNDPLRPCHTHAAVRAEVWDWTLWSFSVLADARIYASHLDTKIL